MLLFDDDWRREDVRLVKSCWAVHWWDVLRVWRRIDWSSGVIWRQINSRDGGKSRLHGRKSRSHGSSQQISQMEECEMDTLSSESIYVCSRHNLRKTG